MCAVLVYRINRYFLISELIYIYIYIYVYIKRISDIVSIISYQDEYWRRRPAFMKAIKAQRKLRSGKLNPT
jgi:hypothetical protein